MSVEPVPRFKHSFSLDPKFVYHVAPTSRTALIERHGLKINMPGKWRRNMECDRWSDVFYGVQPLYVVTDPSRIPTYLEGDLFEIRADGLELACDLPSLLEYGPRVDLDSNTLFWGWDPNRPLKEASLDIGDLARCLNEKGHIAISDLLRPGSRATIAAIEVTGTACVLEDIPTELVRLVPA